MSIEVKSKRYSQPCDLTVRPLGLLRNTREGDLINDELPDKEAIADTINADVNTNTGKVIQLPMLKLNLESLTGSSINEDNLTLESTRKTLRTLIDDCKRSLQTTEIKNYEFITPINSPIKHQSVESKLNSKRSYNKPRNSEKLPPLKRKDVEVSRRNSVAPRTPDAICSVALTNQVVPYTEDQNYLEYLDGETSNNLEGQLSNSMDMASWNSYANDSSLRKGSFKGCSKHEYLLKKHRFQRELMEERVKAKQDLSMSWVKISHPGYKASPIYQYTTYQQGSEPSPQPPNNTCEHCPMCTLYRSDRLPTTCPPNSPRTNITDHQQESSQEPSLQPEDIQFSARSNNLFSDDKRLQPISSSRLAQKQGFRGSKPPITFKMAFCK